MKILYIGNADPLAAALVEQFGKENDEVFLLSPVNFERNSKPKHPYKYYESSKSIDLLDGIFHAVFPEIVIWAGAAFMSPTPSAQERYTYLSELNYWLERCTKEGNKRLLLLSSSEIYGYSVDTITEETPCNPVTERGMLMAQAEQMVALYQKQCGLKPSILRCGQVYDYSYKQGRPYFVEQLVEVVSVENKALLESDYTVQPIAVRDLADAIKRTVYSGQEAIYNVCSDTPLLMSRLYKLIARKLKLTLHTTPQTMEPALEISSEKIKGELEWSQFKKLDIQLHAEPLDVVRSITPIMSIEKIKNKQLLPRRILRVVENIALFCVFATLQYIFRDNALFEGIDWMILYIVSIGLFFGVSQSFLSVLLASVVYFMRQNISFAEITNFYSYAGGVVRIAQYIFLGIVTAYVTDYLKEDIRSQSVSYELLQEEKDELSIICNENISIKNEYEKRLLSAKNSLPTLYSIIGKISVLEPERIFMEILAVISDQLETDTVSFYMAKKHSQYLRLVTSRNEQSIYIGKSWNLNDTPNIKESIEQGHIFEGDHWKGEPALVSPVVAGGSCIAVIVVKDIPFQKQTLYQVNLLRTLTILIAESVSKAIQYENMVRGSRYLEGTDILLHDEFMKLLEVEKQKLHQGIAESCLLRCRSDQTPQEIFKQVGPMLRNTDNMGFDKNNIPVILLGNTSETDAAFVLERLKQRGAEADIIPLETLLEE